MGFNKKTQQLRQQSDYNESGFVPYFIVYKNKFLNILRKENVVV